MKVLERSCCREGNDGEVLLESSFSPNPLSAFRYDARKFWLVGEPSPVESISCLRNWRGNAVISQCQVYAAAEHLFTAPYTC